ncbi:hypothetical protein EYC80_008973 [Monilinia laxa]|uniref:Uncharacterized protein n=1 Tax=Monilinia laxa TaxID=61186 RepID=A0A5N6K213_MONLA|nr:hypothetical protein EYC80_008973 [Monilinia laxa]
MQGGFQWHGVCRPTCIKRGVFGSWVLGNVKRGFGKSLNSTLTCVLNETSFTIEQLREVGACDEANYAIPYQRQLLPIPPISPLLSPAYLILIPILLALFLSSQTFQSASKVLHFLPHPYNRTEAQSANPPDPNTFHN